ncbi:MAG TPA: protein-L-isoaspartate(D-aspartate) O-methyltransferase [Xanthobacteraceae bacterium]|nr:protein-L-isoaspartate(D-aspartate) O-methyltransferase [Xanthobacteraceae bacterium]
MTADHFEVQRQHLLDEIRAEANFVAPVTGKSDFDDRVIGAMAKVPRHEFVPVEAQGFAYANVPLAIGHGKTISQPFIVAIMTDLLDLRPDDVVLEVGTGLGYQAAILAELAGKVYSVELIDELAAQAKQRLKRQGYANLHLKVGNGYHGWPEHAPFDKMIVTAAPDLIPPPLIYQLKAGGRMVLPVGLPDAQRLIVADKDAGGRLTTREILPVRFSVLDDPEQPVSRPS